MRLRVAASLVLAVIVVGVVFGVLAYDRQNEDGPTRADPTTSGRLAELEPLMSQAQIVRLLGKPPTVYRTRQRAQCWRYVKPIVQMCFGPSRRLVWWGGTPYSTPGWTGYGPPVRVPWVEAGS